MCGHRPSHADTDQVTQTPTKSRGHRQSHAGNVRTMPTMHIFMRLAHLHSAVLLVPARGRELPSLPGAAAEEAAAASLHGLGLCPSGISSVRVRLAAPASESWSECGAVIRVMACGAGIRVVVEISTRRPGAEQGHSQVLPPAGGAASRRPGKEPAREEGRQLQASGVGKAAGSCKRREECRL